MWGRGKPRRRSLQMSHFLRRNLRRRISWHNSLTHGRRLGSCSNENTMAMVPSYPGDQLFFQRWEYSSWVVMTFSYVDTALTFRNNLQPPSSRQNKPPYILKMEAASSSKTYVPTKHTVLSQKTITGQHKYFNFPVFPDALLSYALSQWYKVGKSIKHNKTLLTF